MYYCDAWQTEENLMRLKAWARDGLSRQQIADNIGICEGTLRAWEKKYPSIKEALSFGRDIADIHVENALYESCLGRTAKVQKAIKLKRSIFSETTGKKIAEEEYIGYADEEVYTPPNFQAQAFWLANRKSNKWAFRPEDKQDKEIIDSGGVVLLPAVLPQLEPPTEPQSTIAGGDADG